MSHPFWLYAILLGVAAGVAVQLNLTVAIQQNNETLSSYLPLISGCNYSHPNIIPGTVQITPLDSYYLFSQLQYEEQLSFWGPVKNGITISLALPSIVPSQYDGYSYYDSPVIKESRQFILYDIDSASPANLLTFYFAQATMLYQMMELNISIDSTLSVNLNDECQDIVVDCAFGNTTITFAGNYSFLFLCLQDNSAFVFQPLSQTPTGTVLDFSQYPSIVSVVGNSALLQTQIQNGSLESHTWDFAIFVNSQQQIFNATYLIQLDGQSDNYTSTSFTEEQSEVSLIINRLWGSEESTQESKWMEIFSRLGSWKQSQLIIPGNVVSMFVSDRGNIYIESTDGLKNYLVVFEESTSSLIANVTYMGIIVFYGSDNVFFYNDPTKLFYKISLARPIFLINNTEGNTPNTLTSTTLNLTCGEDNFYINYTILWTSIEFPSSLIIQLDNNTLTSESPILNFEVTKRFAVFGPAYDIYVNSTPSISEVVIDSSAISIDSNTFDIVEFKLMNGILLKLILAIAEGIFTFSTQSRTLSPLFRNPCGFTEIVNAVKTGPDQYLITNSDGSQCICSHQMVDCQAVPHNQSLLATSSALQPPAAGRRLLIPSTISDFETKKNLYGLLKSNIVVSILVNNSIVVTDSQTGKTLNSIVGPCTQLNQTNGDLYFREFYDPFLILFCQDSTFLFQYILRSGVLIFNRQIPIYGFRTRKTGGDFYIGFNFLFLPVDSVMNIYPVNPYCCVLRLNPCEFTVSVISEIIGAYSIVAAAKVGNIDIALFSLLDETGSSSLRIYFSNTWISLNESNYAAVSTTENIQIVFKSTYFNFAADFSNEIVFNFSRLQLYPNSPPDFQAITLDVSETSFKNPLLTKSLNYTLSGFCGPIFDSVFSYESNISMSELEVDQMEVLTPTKVMGSVGIEYIQIINPAVFDIAGLTLNDLIILVTETTMEIYNKEYNGVGMYFLQSLPLTEKGCTYYVYEILNTTTATFISNCLSLEFNYLVPLVTLTYDQDLVNISAQFDWVVMPVTLREIFTIVKGIDKVSMFVGIEEGPMKSLTGKLFICEFTICQPLFVSSRLKFLINYSAVAEGDDYYIFTIDYNIIEVYINPTVDVNNTHEPIGSNYSINYTQYIHEDYCSVIKVTAANSTNAYAFLSCPQFYYQCLITYSSTSLKILSKFARYSQCSYQDVFKPQVVMKNNTTIQILYAVCGQNQATLQLQTFQTINSTLPTIYTGYIQIFTLKSPSCSEGEYSPLHIIPISSSNQHNIFNSYRVNGSLRFIYSSINGFLIDNIVSLDPSVSVIYTPFTKNYKFPNVTFSIFNPFHRYSAVIPTTVKAGHVRTGMGYFLFVVFCLMTILTLMCLVGSQLQAIGKNRIFEMRESNFSVVSNEIQYGENLKVVMDRMLEEKRPTHKVSRVSEIELFFIKK